MKTIKTLALVAACAGLAVAPQIALADTTTVSSANSASVTFGPYVRLEAGSGRAAFGDAFWLPPGYPNDPKINFGLGDDTGGFGGIAVGYDWMNGFRADLGLLGTAKSNLAGPWTSTEPAEPGPHADITGGTVHTSALMASLFYSPLEQRGVNSRVQPFLVGGIGIANSIVGPWTRTNTDGQRESRTFSGATSTSIALSVGLGVSVQLTPPGKTPIILEAAYRYYDFGTAHGGIDPLPGNGSSTPVEALSFKNTDQVISISLRIPLKRY